MKLHYFLLCLIPFFGVSQDYLGTKRAPVNQHRAAKCSPPNESTFLATNNVRALVHTAGNLWQVPGQNFSRYEVPKNSGIMAMFTSALWLGGTDINGQLKLAALRYRDGQDYWTGPLVQSEATITGDKCAKYDRHFITTQDMIREFNGWYEAGLADAENGTDLQSTNFPNYKVPKIIQEWPAHGDASIGEDFHLAPFYDRNNNDIYEWEEGDYPWYDIRKDKVCNVDRKVSLYGDENFWWVMNDKGNIHTETGSEPIGMEIRAQAFAFATNDEVNNMTFYNYELINRGTYTLYNSYFGCFVDAALGDPFDDYVGCDVNRGLGYVYNGDAFDADNNGFRGYGSTPAAVGVDFFEGPFQDNDQLDNAFGIGTDEALNGIGYGDGIIDNERFGMRRFLYYVNSGGGANPNQTDPTDAPDYYNFLRGFWKDGTPFYYGGSGHLSDPEANPNMRCDFMFPGDTDPQGWGTNGIPQAPWTEITAGNEPYDRRFLQSAGPFVLKPGAVNNITVGVVWARAAAGGPFASVEVLRRADDKAQALFENCFKVLDGPNSPDMSIQELENQLILTIQNPLNSNNVGENYKEFDPFIVAADSAADKFYRFQGYQIFQVISTAVSVSDILDVSKSRLVAQCDIKDNIGTIINFEYDEDLQASIPVEKVRAANEGIRHSFSITADAFAQGERRLVNFKRYYYMAVAYAHNNYAPYDPNDPSKLDGQKKRYISSRKATLGEVKVVEGIPHLPAPEAGGTMHLLAYGQTPEITRLDGRGNGSHELDLTNASLQEILTHGIAAEPTYQKDQGPIQVKIVDPLNVVGGYFECRFDNFTGNNTGQASWTIYRYGENGELLDFVASDRTIASDNEQLIPKWGISVQIFQHKYYHVGAISVPTYAYFTDPLSCTMTFADSSKRWLTMLQDDDSFFPTNWIRSGNFLPLPADDDPALGYRNPACYRDKVNVDPEKKYAKLLNGGLTHFSLVGNDCAFMPVGAKAGIATAQTLGTMARASSVDIVITENKDLWTRCAVIELGRDENLNIGQAQSGTLRRTMSVDKEGLTDASGTFGMGWFPGYAIDLETGLRLHMAFGENSFLQSEKGADMIWNPTDRLLDSQGNPLMGGMQPIYVFGAGIANTTCPYYNGSNTWIYDQLLNETSNSYRVAYSNLMWVVNTLGATHQEHLSTDVKIRLRINKEYENYNATGKNGGKPMYSWNMNPVSTQFGRKSVLADVLKLINVVPNPYYAYSEYENSQLDTRVKITNLPENCTVKIYNVSGKQIRSMKKSNRLTFLDWNLKNDKGIPVASGIYLIHVDVPDVGEVVLKSFVGMRVPDLETL